MRSRDTVPVWTAICFTHDCRDCAENGCLRDPGEEKSTDPRGFPIGQIAFSGIEIDSADMDFTSVLQESWELNLVSSVLLHQP